MLILPSRGADWRTKPPQWGPLSAVQSSVRHNAERLGIDPGSIVFFLPLWEMAGSVAHDYSSNTSLTITGNYSWQENNLRLEPNQGRVCLPDFELFSGTKNFTIEVIFSQYEFYSENKIVDLAGEARIFLQTGENQADNVLHVRGRLDGSWGDYLVGPALTADETYHVVFVRNSNSGMSLYVNGVLVDSNANTDSIDANSSDSLIGSSNLDKDINATIKKVVFCETCYTPDQIALLYEQPCCLLYPARRPIIFDVGAGGTAISPTTLAAETSVASPSISLIRLLGLENASVSTQVTALTLGLAVKQLTGLDVSSDPQVTAASIQAVRAILESDISTATEVTDLAVQVARACGLDDVASQTQVVAAAMSVVRAILTGGVSSSAEVTDVAIAVARMISAVTAESATQVSPLTLDRVRHIALDAVQSATSVGALGVSQGLILGGADVGAETAVSDATIRVLRQIGIDGVASASQITAVALGTSGSLGILDVSSQTQVAAVALQVLRQLQEADVASDAEVTEAAIQAVRAVSFAGVSSETEISAVAISSAEALGITDVSALSTIGSIALGVIRAIGGLTVEVSSQVDDVTISALRAVFFDAVSVATEVGAAAVAVAATGMGTITDTMIESLTTGRVFESATTKREIHET